MHHAPSATRHLASAALVALLGSGCVASRAVAPLEQGQHGITASFGGPFLMLGSAPVPVPFGHLGYRYGIDGKTDVHAGVHLTSLALVRVGGFDVGVTRELVTARGARPRLMVGLDTYWFFGDFSDGEPDGGFRFFPDLHLVLTWDLPDRQGRRPHRVYLGLDTFVQPFPTPGAILTPILGTELRVHRLVGFQFELGWHQPWVDTTPMVPVWVGPGNRGVIDAKLGLVVYVPTARRPDRPEGAVPPPEEAP